MRRHLSTALLMLTMACGMAAADDPPAKPVPANTTSATDSSVRARDSERKSNPLSANPVATPASNSVEGFKAKKTDAPTTAKADGLGYTQVGGYIRLKLDRPKTQMSLYENSTYTIIAERGDVGILGAPNPRLIIIEDTDGGSISFHTVKPGVATLTYFDDAENAYIVEITILGDTRQLQSQLEKLYPQVSIQAIKVRDSVLLRGTVAKPEHVAEIVEIAEQFYPNVLNQLKVGGVPVDQRQPAQPRPVHIDFARPHTVYSEPQPHPVRTPSPWRPVSPPKTAKPQVMIQTLVLEIDWKQFAESKVELVRTIRAFASDPKERNLSDPRTKQPPFLAVAVPQNTTDGIVRLLTATKAVEVISRPMIRTLAGQPADIVIGQEIPVIVNGGIRNGKQRVELKYRRIGTTLKLTPWLVSNGGIKLAVVVEHSQHVGSTGARFPGGFSVPNIRSHKVDVIVELKAGHSIILVETAPPAAKEKNQAVGKGLMVVLSPSIIATTPTAQRTPTKAGVANVVRLTSVHQAVRPAPQRVQPATFDAPAPQPEPQDLHQSIRELRSDVRALRRDVGRLLKVLEKKQKNGKELRQSKASPAKKEILKALEKKVSLKFDEVSLAEVIKHVQAVADVNIWIDGLGLQEEGVRTDQPVSIHVDGIMLKSALNLMLNPLNLTYQVRDEVLVITSKSRAQAKMVVVTYPVADLVIPIPTAGPVPIDEIAARVDKGAKSTLSVPSPVIDFDTLTETILSTVQPDSWDEVGGSASIRPFETTLSLVIRQTPQAHQEIADLLEQLRRLQDVQVTLEARFLDKLPEDIWKRIGVDFDFKKDADGSLARIILNDRQTELLLKAVQNDARANLIQVPKVTLFNGRTAGITRFTVGGKEQPLKHSLYVQPVISADRRNIRLNLRVSDRESPWTDTRAYVNTVPDGKTLLIEIGRRDGVSLGVPILNKIPYIARSFKPLGVRSKNERVFLLVRPRIVILEEEEELPGIPQE